MIEAPSINIEFFFNLVYTIFVRGGPRLLAFFEEHVMFFKVVSIFVSLVLLTGIVYATLRINQIRGKEAKALAVPGTGAFRESSEERVLGKAKWNRIETLIESESPSDWRIAVIEADILLDELVTAMGYGGENLGEKLKGIERSDFTTLDKAWEAHKVRNEIAHAGSDFILTQREARRTIALFADVFREFDYI